MLNWRGLVAACLALTFLAHPAFAFDPSLAPPPYANVSDKLGMNLTTGLWKLAGPSVHIGPQDRRGLGWTYYFNGGSYLDLGLYENTIKYVMGYPYHLWVTVLNSNEEFDYAGPSTWTSTTGGGTLTQSGGNFTYTDAFGAVTQFTGITPIGAYYQTTALGSSTSYPDGLGLTYTWRSSSAAGYEISSVNNNLGYQIKFNFSCNTSSSSCYTKVVGVTAVNNAIEYCSPTAQNCSGLSNPWPTLSWSIYSPSYAYYQITLTDTMSHTWTYLGQTTGAHTDMTVTLPTGQTIRNSFDEDYSTWPYSYINLTATDGLNAWTYSITDNGDGTTTGCSYDPNSVTRCVLSDNTTGNPYSDTLDPGGVNSLMGYGYASPSLISSVSERNGDFSAYTYSGSYVASESHAATGKPLNTTASFTQKCDTSSYSFNGKPVSITDANNNCTDYTYDASSGNVATVEGPTVGGQRPLTTYTYTAIYAWYKNSGGSIVQAATPVYMLTGTSTCLTMTSSCSGTSDERKSTLTYESGSSGVASNVLNLTSTVQAGNASCPSPNCSTTTDTYDIFSNVSSISVANSASDKTVFFYDNDQRQVGAVRPLSGGGGTSNYATTKTTYDDSDRVIQAEQGYSPSQSRYDFDNNFTSLVQSATAYDANTGLEMKITGSIGGTAQTVTQFSYDAGQRPLCTAVRENASVFGSLPGACTQSTTGSYGYDLISQRSYDPANRISTVVSGVGTGSPITALTNDYDAYGRLDWVEDGKGNRSGYVYDNPYPYGGNNHLLKVEFPDPAIVHTVNTSDYEEYGYDGFGNLTSKRLRDGSTFILNFDALERLYKRQDPSSSSNDVYYGYDLVGDVLYAHYSSAGGSGIDYTWDALGRKLSENSYGHTIASQYDASGNRTKLTYPDSNYIDYSYDLLGRIYQVKENGSTVLAQYAYDDLGRTTGITRSNSTSTSASYGGSSQSWSLSQDLASTGQDVTISMDYTPGSQLTQRSISNSSYRYQNTTNATTIYCANGLNQYVASTGLCSGGASFTYDGRGNITSDGSRSFSYDYDNELTGVSGSASMSLGYDPAGRLQTTTASSTTENYVYDGSALVVEYDSSGNILRRYVPGQGTDETIVWYEGVGLSTPNWLHTDEQGSTIAASNISGTGALYAYSATGEPQGGFSGGGPIFRYTGQAQLTAAGLYYYKARVYDPASGRFLQTDPVGYSQGLNLYSYALNRYPNSTDSSGMTCGPNTGSITINGVTTPLPTIPGNPDDCIGGDPGFIDVSDGTSPGDPIPLSGAGDVNVGHQPPPADRKLSPAGTNSGHSYDGNYKVCRKGSKNCTLDEVYNCLRENPAPFVSGAPVTEGQHVNVPGFGPIVTSVSPQSRVIVNSTLEGHELFPGGVIRTVTENDNWIGVDTAGWGTGHMGGLNSALAPWVWSYQTSIWISGCVRAGK